MASSTGIRNCSLIRLVQPTICHCVTVSTALMWYTPLAPSQSPWCTVSTRRNPGRPCGSGLPLSPIETGLGPPGPGRRPERLCPANSIPALDSRNSRICSRLKCSAFCIFTCIRPKHAHLATPSFMLMLHWNQLWFHAHLALDNSQPCGTVLLVYANGFDLQAHMLPDGAGDEAPDAVVLPTGGLGDLGHRRALGAAPEVQDDALFPELARHLGLLHFGGLLAGDLLLGLLLRRDLGLLGGFLRALVGLGRVLLLAGSLLRGGLLRRDLRALFRNGGSFGGVGSFCVLHGRAYRDPK